MNNYFLNREYNVLTALIFIFFISILTGPFLSDTSLIIICLFSIYYYKKSFFFYLKNNTLLITFFGLLICFLITSIFAESPLISTAYSLAYSRYVIFIFAIFAIFINHETILHKLHKLIFVLIFFIFINIFLQDFVGYDLFGNRPLFDYRLSSFFKEELIMGKITMGLLTIYLSIYYLIKKELFNYSTLTILTISLYIILMSGERVALFNFFIYLFLYFLLLSKNNFKKALALIFSLIVILFIFLSFKDSVRDRIIFTTLDHITSTEYLKKSKVPFTVYSDEHEALYNVALENFKYNPLTGSGVGSFRDFCQNYSHIHKNHCATHPHNNLFEVLSENGIFAFSLLFYVFVFSVIYFIRSLYYFFKKNDYIPNIFISLGCSSFFFPYVPSFSFHSNNHFNVIIYFSIGLFVYLNHKKKLN